MGVGGGIEDKNSTIKSRGNIYIRVCEKKTFQYIILTHINTVDNIKYSGTHLSDSLDPMLDRVISFGNSRFFIGVELRGPSYLQRKITMFNAIGYKLMRDT